MIHSFDSESQQLTSASYLAAKGLSTNELVLGGIGMMRTSIMDLLDMLLAAGVTTVDVQILKEIISESELELEEIPHEQFLRESGGPGNG